MEVSPLAKGRKLNWRPSLKGHHVKKYSCMELTSPALRLAPVVDLRSQQSPVWDQGQTGSCSGFSTRSHAEFLQLKELRNQSPSGKEPLEWSRTQFVPISAFFPYWNARAVEGSTATDAGAMTLLDLMTQAQLKGLCAEATWPSDGALITKCPPSTAYGEAWHHKVPEFYGINATSISELKRCLANGFVFSFGIPVYSSFMSQQVAETGIVPMPGFREMLDGGHAVLCVGYNDSMQSFIFKNSWSAQWGAAGYGFLPYDYMLNYADDTFTMRLVPTTAP